MWVGILRAVGAHTQLTCGQSHAWEACLAPCMMQPAACRGMQPPHTQNGYVSATAGIADTSRATQFAQHPKSCASAATEYSLTPWQASRGKSIMAPPDWRSSAIASARVSVCVSLTPSLTH